MTCSQCPTTAPHDMHMYHMPGSPYAMRVAGDRRSVYLWMPDGTMVKRAQPDAVSKLRADVRRLVSA